MWPSYREESWLLQHPRQEVMAGVDLLPEFSGRVDRGVDVAPQARLRRRQGVGYGSERSVAHDKHVHVAVPA
jgi:hypothetical protein